MEGVAGVSQVVGIGSVQLGARIDGHGPRDLVPVVLFGYELAPKGLPDAVPAYGEVYADRLPAVRRRQPRAARSAFGPARTPVRVIGFLDDSRYSGQGTLWGSLATWRSMLAANRPGERVGEGVEQALVVRVAGADASRRPARSIAPPATPRRR